MAPSKEPRKGWFVCRECRNQFFDYLDPSGNKKDAMTTLPVDVCNGCAKQKPRYRHKVHPDQQELDFDGMGS